MPFLDFAGAPSTPVKTNVTRSSPVLLSLSTRIQSLPVIASFPVRSNVLLQVLWTSGGYENLLGDRALQCKR